MLETGEYKVGLSVEGAFTAWQQGFHTFESAMRDLSNGLVNGARAIQVYSTVEGAEEWISDLSYQWWEDLDKLPHAARKLTLTRMVVAGIREPIRYRVAEEEA